MDPGERLGRYELVRLLGEGGMGRVYEAVLHGPAGFVKQVALKVLHEAGEGLVREARLGGLLRHPNLVEVYALEQVGDTWVCAMELVSGGTITPHMPLSPKAVQEVGIQVCAGLAHAHEQVGLVHLDLKPDNLLVDGGIIKIADLGIARARGFGVEGGIRGTPEYMAPEHLAGGAVDTRADVWSMGVVLVALASGTGWSHPGAVSWLEPILARCFATDPADRFPSAAALGEALAGLELGGDSLVDSLGLTGAVAARSVIHARTLDLLKDDRPVTNLATEADAFVGRERELADLAERLAEPGIVTLKAIGGMGKTRLSRRAAAAYHETTQGEAWFCDLSESRSFEGLLHAVAVALDVRLSENLVDQLGYALAGRNEPVVVLDTFDLVVEHAGVVARWRELAPRARFLVTSREPLHIPGEQVVTLKPLPESDAVSLLIERASARGGNTASDPDLPELARRLDGIPLALELAAGRLGMLSAAAIVSRLDNRFQLLRSRERGVSKRQATLRGTLDWSWELLDEDEREGLVQVAVFSGGFTVEAAEAVLDLPGGAWALDVVEQLLDRSLLTRKGDRIAMYESVRAYAAEKPQPEDLERAHGAWYARFGTSEAIAGLDGPGGDALRRELNADLDNFMVAVHRAIGRGDADIAAATCRGMWAVVQMIGPFDAAVAVAERVMAMELTPETTVILRRICGTACLHAGRIEEAQSHYNAALAMHEVLGVAEEDVEIHNELATLFLNQGRLEEAEKHYLIAVEQYRRAGDRRSESKVLNNLGTVFNHRGRTEESREYYEAARDMAIERGDLHHEATTVGNLGILLFREGHLEEARANYRASLALFKAAGNRRNRAIMLGNLGNLELLRGRPDAARDLLKASIEMHREVGHRRNEGISVGNLGTLEVDMGNDDLARPLVQKALDVAREMRDQRQIGNWYSVRASLRSRAGDHVGARADIARAEPPLANLGDPLTLGAVLAIRAEVEARAGDPTAAKVALRRAEDIADSEKLTGYSDLLATIEKSRSLIEEAE